MDQIRIKYECTATNLTTKLLYCCWETDIFALSAFSSSSALFSHTKWHFQLKLRWFMYNTTQHLTVAWFYYWIKALGHMELNTVHVKGNATSLCDDTNAPVWTEGKESVFMYVKGGCVNKEVMERGDAAWPCGNLVWLSEQPSTRGPYCVLRGKGGFGRYLTKTEKSLWLQKRATKPANSWCSGKCYENNPSHTVRFSVSTPLLSSPLLSRSMLSSYLTLASQMGLCLRGPSADLWPQRLGNNDSCR